MAWAIVHVLPVPVAPSSVWWRMPRWSPSTSCSIACGWSPVGSNGATSSEVGHAPDHSRTRPRLEQAFDLRPDAVARRNGRGSRWDRTGHTGRRGLRRETRRSTHEGLFREVVRPSARHSILASAVPPPGASEARSEPRRVLADPHAAFLILLGIIQFGFIFNTYVTMTNAAREAARHRDRSTSTTGPRRRTRTTSPGTSRSRPRSWLDEPARQDRAPLRDRVDLDPERPDRHERRPGRSPTCCRPASPTANARTGQQITVRATYHQDLIIPLISALLPKDAGGRHDPGRRSHDGHQLMALDAAPAGGPPRGVPRPGPRHLRPRHHRPVGRRRAGVRRRALLQRAALPPERRRRRRPRRRQRPDPGRDPRRADTEAPARS